jgi:hypothetical protein
MIIVKYRKYKKSFTFGIEYPRSSVSLRALLGPATGVTLHNLDTSSSTADRYGNLSKLNIKLLKLEE